MLNAWYVTLKRPHTPVVVVTAKHNNYSSYVHQRNVLFDSFEQHHCSVELYHGIQDVFTFPKTKNIVSYKVKVFFTGMHKLFHNGKKTNRK